MLLFPNSNSDCDPFLSIAIGFSMEFCALFSSLIVSLLTCSIVPKTSEMQNVTASFVTIDLSPRFLLG